MCGIAIRSHPKRIGIFNLQQIGKLLEGISDFGVMDRLNQLLSA